MRQGQGQGQGTPISANMVANAPDVVCECGNYTFEEVLLMKKISAIISPTGSETIVPIPVFACNACGRVEPHSIPAFMVGDDGEMRGPEDTPTETEPEKKPSLILEK